MAKLIIDISYWQDPVLIDYDQLSGANETLKIRGIFDKAITTMVLDD